MSFNINGGSSPEHSYTHGKSHGGEEHANPFASQILGPHGWSQEVNDQLMLSNVQPKEQEQFSIKRAGKAFLKGVVHPFKVMWQHPFLTIGALAGTVALLTAAPITLPLMVIGGLGFSAYQLGKGGIKAYSAYRKGDNEEAEKAFANIGEGALGLVTSLFGFRTSAALAAEARTTSQSLKAATSEAGRVQAFEQGIDAASAAKYGSRGNALKEHFNLITTRDGWRAIGAQFKPDTLFANIRLKWGNFVAMFKAPPETDIAEITHQVQAFQEIPAHKMPEIITGDKSAHGTAAYYQPGDKTVNVTTDYLTMFKSAQKQSLASMKHRSPESQKKAVTLIDRVIDKLPSPLQNLIANWMRKRANIENVMAHEIRHSQQHKQIEQLSTRQVNEILDAEFLSDRTEIAKIAKENNMDLEELIKMAKEQTLKGATGGLKLSETDATGQSFEQGKRAFLDFAQGLSDNLQRMLDPSKLKEYIGTPIEVDARVAGAKFASRDAFEKLSQGSKDITNPLVARTIRNRLIEDRLNAILIEIGKLKKAKASPAEIQALEDELKLLYKLPGAKSMTGNMLNGEAKMKDINENPNTLGRKIKRATFKLIGKALRPFLDKQPEQAKATGAS